MKKTKKNFRLTLNNWFNGILHKNGLYHQTKRGYGDYLYYQDNVKFNVLFNLWDISDTKKEFETKV